jgi:glutathionylspermidine synthase
MHRFAISPRADWREKVERIGLTYHSHDNGPYWDESACYELSAGEVEQLESAANTLHRLCIAAAGQVVERSLWGRFGIPEAAIPAIVRSWERDDFSIYGRFDIAFDGSGPPKLLEYNADTPTALVEAAVAQWFWLEELRPGCDQFNSIHERLIAAWKRWGGAEVHFASIKNHPEDEMTTLYLRDTCAQAGLRTKSVFVEDIGWDSARRLFVDLDGVPIRHCFKLYPWEWMWAEEFGRLLDHDAVHFFEPPWKMILSNKALLPLLWEIYPGHPNLLPSYEEAAPLGGDYVRKPKLGREGGNVSIFRGGLPLYENPGEYGEEGFVYQQPAPIPVFDGQRPVFGVWIIDHEAAGLGVREDSSPVTGNLSRFVPHYFRQP